MLTRFTLSAPYFACASLHRLDANPNFGGNSSITSREFINWLENSGFIVQKQKGSSHCSIEHPELDLTKCGFEYHTARSNLTGRDADMGVVGDFLKAAKIMGYQGSQKDFITVVKANTRLQDLCTSDSYANSLKSKKP
jgi:hypothetical protein